GVAFVAALGTDRLRTAYDRLVSNTPGRLAVAAGDAHQVPFGGAQGAMEIPKTVRVRICAHDTRNRQAAAHRTYPGHSHLVRGIGRDAAREVRAVDLQG